MGLSLTAIEDPARLQTVKDIRFWDVYRQFMLDVYDKEVQSAATYSYLWLADQMGHIGLGIILSMGFGLVVQLLQVPAVASVLGRLVLTIAGALGPRGLSVAHYLGSFGPDSVRVLVPFGVAFGLCGLWEISAFRTFLHRCTGVFPPDKGMLWLNALYAFLYMLLGIVLGTAWQCALLFSDKRFLLPGWAWPSIGLGVTLVAAGLALYWAYEWVRQKMIWQKAGIPFLFRLADARNTIAEPEAKRVHDYAVDFLKAKGQRAVHTPVLIVSGPLGAGKTSLACGLGTEAAFSDLTVRYITFDKLLQLVALDEDDLGPLNIVYWRWKLSDVLIIDDVTSGSPTAEHRDPAAFKSMTESLMGKLAGKASVWVIGPKQDDWENAIRGVCRGAGDPEPEVLMVALNEPTTG